MNCCAVCCHKQFGPGGCQVPVVKDSGNATKCGQTDSLDIIDKVVEEFENKMKQLDAVAIVDSVSGLQAKLHLQEELIRNLTVQNEMLVMVVKKLEAEATKRASKPEEKFVKTAEIGIESMVNKYNTLTTEMAEKHKMILSLRQNVQRFEHMCIQSSRQCQLKDEVIKDLQTQIKMYKNVAHTSSKVQEVAVQHNFCPLNIKTNMSQYPLSINLDDQAPTHDSLPALLNPTLAINAQCESARSFSDGGHKKHKRRTKLTADSILHEHYGFKKDDDMSESLETFPKPPTKNNVTVPKHVSVRTFVHNLEKTAVCKTGENEKRNK